MSCVLGSCGLHAPGGLGPERVRGGERVLQAGAGPIVAGEGPGGLRPVARRGQLSCRSPHPNWGAGEGSAFWGQGSTMSGVICFFL